MPDFLPRRSAEMVTWSRNFDSVLNAQYESYGISQQDAQLYSQLHAAFAQAFADASAAATNSDTAIRMKQQTEAAVRKYARVLGGMVRTNPNVTDAQRVTLGLRPRRRRPTEPQLPVDPPKVLLKHSGARTVTILVYDPASPTRRGLPKGAGSATIFTFVGENPPASLEQWKPQLAGSHARFRFTFDAKIPAGAKVWFSAYWNKRTLEEGPRSEPVCTRVGFAEIAMAG